MQRPLLGMAMAQLNRYFSATILPLIFLWAGCHNPDDFALNSDESPNIDRFLTLSAAGDTTLPADGFSTVELVARVGDVSEGTLSILFTTTAGTLRVGTRVRIDSVGTRVRTDSAVVRTDAGGEARIELVSEPRQATAQVRARVVDIEPAMEQELRIHFNAVADEEILVFVDPPDSAFAHGLALVPFTVRIAPEVEGDERQVLFETTGGTFPFAADTNLGQIVRADAEGLATAHLRTPEQVGEALVRATVLTFSQETVIRFYAVADEEILVFVDPPDSAFAHGLALVPFTVRIAPEVEGDERQVLFETTGGTFPFAADTNLGQIVRADAEGLATAHLRTPEQVGEALVRATVLTFSQERQIRFVPAPTDSVLLFVEAPEVAPADGQSLSRFSVKISPLLQRDEERTVLFLTTLGSFVLPDDDGSTVSVLADADGVATAFLRSPNQFDEAFVRASVKGFIQQRMLQFDWAGPDSIIVRPALNRLSLVAGEQIQIEAELIRLDGRGQVTENFEVTFAVVDSLGNPLEGTRFVDVTRTNDQGRASAVFAVDDTLYQGIVSISVRPARIASEVVGRAELMILPP